MKLVDKISSGEVNPAQLSHHRICSPGIRLYLVNCFGELLKKCNGPAKSVFLSLADIPQPSPNPLPLALLSLLPSLSHHNDREASIAAPRPTPQHSPSPCLVSGLLLPATNRKSFVLSGLVSPRPSQPPPPLLPAPLSPAPLPSMPPPPTLKKAPCIDPKCRFLTVASATRAEQILLIRTLPQREVDHILFQHLSRGDLMSWEGSASGGELIPLHLMIVDD